MKKIVFLIMMMMVSSLGFAYDFLVDGVYYYYNSDGKTVTATSYFAYLSMNNCNYYKGDIVIPDSVEYGGKKYEVNTIDIRTFYNCYNVTSVTIPRTVKTIGDYAFYNCSKIESLVLPDSVTAIGQHAFESCTSLKSFIIPDSVTSIGEKAFSSCFSLTSIVIPKGVVSLGNSMFSSCTSLSSIVVEEGNPTYDSRNNCNAIIETATNTLLSGCQNTVIPTDVTTIGSFSFYGCTGLTEVSFPEGITTISDRAFYGCSNIQSLTFPSTLTTISEWAFSKCSSIPSITLPASLQSLGDYGFYYCNSLDGVTIPESVRTLGNYAFAGCDKMTYISLNEGLQSIGTYCFSGCKGLTTVDIPGANTVLKDYAFTSCSGLTTANVECSVIRPSAFLFCPALTTVSLGKAVTAIGDQAFKSCDNLRKVCLSSAPVIGANAFADDDRLSYIFVSSTEAPYLSDKSFTDEVYQYAYIHVPFGSYEEFASAYGWRNFKHFKEDLDVNGQTFYAGLRVKQGNGGYVEQYVKVDETYTLYIGAENARINTVLFNGEDVTDKLENGYYTTPVIKGRSVLSVSYEELADGVVETENDNLKVYGNNGMLYVRGINETSDVSIYSLDGKLVYQNSVYGETVVTLPSAIYVVNVGSRTLKVAL